jgi:NAD(P)-dependent dehydrogenase (short-subunit alcohol dehydrogenase family)
VSPATDVSHAPSHLRIDGKSVIVTGAAYGQGRVTARVLAGAGGVVYLTDVDTAAGTDAAVEAAGTFVAHDVTDPDSWAAVVARVVADTGRIDVLVNNAGIIEWATMTQTPLATWERVIAVNQTGPLLGMQAVAPTMRAQRAGSIVNTSSVGGLGGSSPCFAYGASKWALRGMTRGAAQELGPDGIRVNAILPGTIESRMIEGQDPALMARGIPLGRIGAREEVARLTLWLASDESSFVSGADHLVDGGAKA